MKLAPRKRRERADYLLENAAALQLGRLYLGWGKKRRRGGAAAAPAPARQRKRRPPGQAPTQAARHCKRRRAAPPPTKSPTPAPPPHAPSSAVDNADYNEMLTVIVRTMNGSSFRLVLRADTILHDLKYQILSMIAPGPVPPNPLRLPMLVMNGRALMPDNATLRSLRLPTLATIYCFPESC
ncbi:hypothetical protein ABL78_0635 [Leptomonas seymouri]|uniref:Ubiquitin-like domain-containing protein n=1 Tax=Leptomonas seymouri TaxID=5684 RepID=A0A0N1IMG1_LEPSE|nr:hypothetical protein ABL78_0635 [Leptomonas seymouri]|eukprot:KPI90253.1 hypothetical protein ABL78_0635 [Leptomonas seymouri]